MSTQSSNSVVSLSFKPGSVSHVQVTTDLGGPLELRVVLSLSTGPWVQYGTGSSPSAADFTVGNGYGNFAIATAHAAACGGVTLEASQPNRVFSATAY